MKQYLGFNLSKKVQFDLSSAIIYIYFLVYITFIWNVMRIKLTMKIINHFGILYVIELFIGNITCHIIKYVIGYLYIHGYCWHI